MKHLRQYTKFLFLSGTLLITACTTKLPPLQPGPENLAEQPASYEEARHILDTRCIACHSCLESPCQLNMQSWQGLKRGAYHENVYDGARISPVQPQRMFEDAQTEQQWRDRGFIDVLKGGEDSIFISTLRLAQLRSERFTTPVKDSQICPQTPDAVVAAKSPELAMPYGLPKLDVKDRQLLNRWVKAGAPNSTRKPEELPANLRAQIQDWTKFFNQSDLKSRIVARYLYEHLFLAHIYFKEQPARFFRLIRSSTSCESPTPIATRQPNNDPGPKMHYCLTEDKATVVLKTHIPYEFSIHRLKWLRENFFAANWKAKEFPAYIDNVAGNPLITFRDIPVEARYRFLLEDAQYEVATFIKGPVCNGSFAVNSIQEQFYVFFVNPQSDLMVRSKDYYDKVAGQLILPGTMGTDLSLTKIVTGYKSILQHRYKARAVLNATLEAQFPDGLSTKDIWDGDGTNQNAVLTVFRHDDNARVFSGARGDISKTVFVLDYSIFERLVYNLVVNFDVFGDVTHQLLTRLYMDILRMDAEDNFLQFLPEAARYRLKNSWYRGFATQMKLYLIEEKSFARLPDPSDLPQDETAKLKFVQHLLFKHMNSKVIGERDAINWKELATVKSEDPVALELKRIAARPEQPAPFANFFPELSLLIVTEGGWPQKVFSLIHNREHDNMSWIFAESLRLAKKEDTLTILPGIGGAYPNRFFIVEKSQLKAFVDSVLSAKSKKAFLNAMAAYRLDRMDERIWKTYDFLNSDLRASAGVDAGVIDLSRYEFD